MTLSGLDGAGKSSQAQRLCEALREHGVDAVVEWMPVAYNPTVDRVKALGNAVLGRVGLRSSEVPADPSAPEGRSTSGGAGKALVRRSALARQVWTTFIAIMNVVAHWRSVLAHTRNGRVVVFDRYTLDSFVRMHAWYEELGSVRFPFWLIRTLSPRPVRSYLLDVPAETAFARKPEQWDLDQLRRQAALYRRGCDELGVRRLDGERAVEELAAEIAADVSAALGLGA